MDEFNQDSLTSFEDQIMNMDDHEVGEFSADKFDYENYIFLHKKDILNFCRIVEPLTKMSVDEYGKSVLIKSVNKDTVLMSYVNSTYVVEMTLANKSEKEIAPFALSIANLKKITNNAFASLVLVQQEQGMFLAVCGSLLFLETRQLSLDIYNIERKPTTNSLDKDVAFYTFRRLGAILSCSDRASEKVIVVKNGHAIFNTGVFSAKVKSPFKGGEQFVIWKSVSEALSVLSEISKVDLKYTVEGEYMYVNCDGQIYCQFPNGSESKIEEFYVPTVDENLKFDAEIVIVNDALLKLISIVKALDYLSDIVSVTFDKTSMTLTIFSANMTNPSVYNFSIVEGAPEVTGDMRQNVDVLKTFLEIAGNDVKYCFNNNGFGIKNELGSFLIRRS